MRFKITFEYDAECRVNRIVKFSCMRNQSSSISKLLDNQMLIDASLVPMSFYNEYHYFAVDPVKKTIAWNTDLYHKYK